MGMFMFWICFSAACGAIVFAVDTGFTISFKLGRQYGLSLPLLDVYA
jgi:hypothetical protein